MKLLSTLGLLAVLALAFNNCGQPGQIAMTMSSSAQNALATPQPDNAQPDSAIYESKKLSTVVTSTSKVDILVIVDNSGSMNYEKQSMANRFGGFIDQLSKQNLDWNVGIITTDVSADIAGGTKQKDGRLVAFGNNNLDPYVLRSVDYPNVSDAVLAFANRIQNLPADEGNGLEQGIKATYRFLERAANPSSVEDYRNKDLLRPDAALAVIVVSDDDESTSENGKTQSAPPEPRNDYKNLMGYIQSSLGVTKSFSFHSIIVKPQDKPCYDLLKTNPDGSIYKNSKGFTSRENEDYGVNYAAFSQLTGGTIGSVCAVDYSGQLSILGNKVIQQVKDVVLECAPVDANADGALDISVKHQETNGSWTSYPASGFTVLGNKFSFNSAAAEGNWDFVYTCKKP